MLANAQTGMPFKCAGRPVFSLNRMAAGLYIPQSCASEALVPTASPMVTLLPIVVGRLLFLGLCLATWMITLSWMFVFSPTFMLCTSPAGCKGMVSGRAQCRNKLALLHGDILTEWGVSQAQS